MGSINSIFPPIEFIVSYKAFEKNDRDKQSRFSWREKRVVDTQRLITKQ